MARTYLTTGGTDGLPVMKLGARMRVPRWALDELARTGRVVRLADVPPPADTVAKLLHEWSRTDRAPLEEYRLPAGTTVIVDEAGLLGTRSLHQLVHVAEREKWRLALVGDRRQLQAVGRGGLFNELCATSRVHELARLHRFHQPWEAEASLRLRAGDPSGLDAYEDRGRIVAGGFGEHLDQIAKDWIGLTSAGKTVAITAATNDHVDALNDAVQRLRLIVGQLDAGPATPIAASEHAYPGDPVATRRNDRRLRATAGEPVRNRDLWMVTAVCHDGSLTVSHLGGHGTVMLPCDYVRDHVRLGYAATEHGNQADTVDVGIQLVSPATTRRGLYVGTTRGREENRIHVVTERADPAEARDVLEAVLAYDRADVPAVTQRRHLAQTERPESSREPDQVVPAWLVGYRDQLEQRREDLAVCLTERAHRRAEAAAELADLQPAVAAARGGWQPYAGRIAAIEDELHTVFRPAMWQAHHDARNAGFGHRHGAARRARIASWRVSDARDRIAAIHAESGDTKQQLDTLQAEARRLADFANPASDPVGLDQLEHAELYSLGQLIDAVDTWTTWAAGRPVATDELTEAVSLLHDPARHAPPLALRVGDIDPARWFELLEPVRVLLVQHGMPFNVHGRHDLEHAGPDLGIDQ